MALMDTVTGGVGAGVQPKDNPNPVQPQPGAAAQTATNSLPLVAPAPMAAATAGAQSTAPSNSAPQTANKQTPAPTDVDNKTQAEVDALFQDFQKQPQPKDAKAALSQKQAEVDAMFKDFPGAGQSQPSNAESLWGKLVDSLPEGLREFAAQARANLGRNPTEQRQAFESMFGTENVKTKGGDLYFRSSPDGTFKKVNPDIWNGLSTVTLSQLLTHISQLPGFAANVAAQGATDTALSPTGPAGFAAGGAAGGAAQAGVNNFLRGAINQVSSLPQESEPQAPWSHLATDVAKESGLNAAGAAVLGPAFGAIGKAYAGFRNQLMKAGDDIQQLASVRTFFNQFKDAVFPSIGEDVGSKAMDAIDAIHDRLGKAVGAIKQEALGLSESSDKKVSMDGTIQKVQDILQRNGYPLDEMGFAKIAPQLPGATSAQLGNQELLGASYRNSLDQMAAFLNRIKRDAIGNNGSELGQVFQDIDNLSRLSKFDAANPTNPEIINMFRTVRNAAATDRNAFLNDLYQTSQSPNSEVWKGIFKEYSSNVDALTDLKAAFRSPQQRELLVNSLNKASSADKLELLDNFKQVLGENSKEWGALRGDIYSQLIDKHIGTDGVFDAAGFAKYLTSKTNQPFLGRLLSKQDQGVLIKGSLEAARMSASNSLTQNSASELAKFAGDLIGKMGALPGVKAIFKLTGGNKKAIDYLTDEGFMDAYNQAAGPEIKQNILDARRLMSGVRDKMSVIGGTTPLEKVASRAQKYVPLAGPTASSAFEHYFSGFAPGMGSAGESQTPAPAQNAPGVGTVQ